ncbi:hypothetical protein AAE478_002678 [Parahypoxylon ruwenzoriense]
MAHVFPFMNTLTYWGILMPSGHGGFKPPSMPHRHNYSPPGNESIRYDPQKGLFEEDPIKAFSIINVWSITSTIAIVETLLLNSIRRQTSAIGKLATGHSGLFFLDPDLMGDMPEAIIAGYLLFVAVSPGGRYIHVVETSSWG